MVTHSLILDSFATDAQLQLCVNCLQDNYHERQSICVRFQQN